MYRLKILIFEFLRFLMIALFVYTAISKIYGYYIFLDQLTRTPFLGGVAMFLSIFIPGIEIIIALMLLVPKTTIKGWWLAASLMSLFSVYIFVMLLLSPSLPCSCGGIVASLSWKQHLVVNILLAGGCWFRIHHYFFIEKFSMHTKGVS